MITEAIKKAVENQNLSYQEARDAMNCIMDGKSTDAQIASLITALRMKGETVDEITGFAEVMREKAVKIKPVSTDLLDTCGTGGDSKNTFNISTAVAFVAAAAGIKVAKHGNRSVSSKCGSADVLESLGVNLDLSPEKVAESIDNTGIGFLYAPLLHGAMKYAIGPRREIGIRTVFNILGPLTNPAGAKRQLLGVFSSNLTEVMAGVLKNLGSERAAVVHGGGYDEITVTGPSNISFLIDGKIENKVINLEELDIKQSSPKDLMGGTSVENAGIIKNILIGIDKGPKRDVVAINSAAAIFIGGKSKSLEEGAKLAFEILENGSAYKKLEDFIKFTNSK
jgi:anthranilate phosphoribosyltransferase